MTGIFLTYIVPVFNGEKYLGRTLESIGAQEGPYEVVIVDDGSTDASNRLAQKHVVDFYARGIPARIIYQENAGEASAVNLGIEHAQGEYISVVSADDVIGNNHLDAAVKVSGKPILMIPNYQTIDSSGEAIGAQIIPDTLGIKRGFLLDFLCVPSVGSVVKRSDALETKRRPYSHISDYDFYFRLLGEKDSWKDVVALGTVVCFWRSHSSNMSKQNIQKKRANYLTFVGSLRDLTFLSPRAKRSLKSAVLLRALLLSLEDGERVPALFFRALLQDPLNACRLIFQMPIQFVLATLGTKTAPPS